MVTHIMLVSFKKHSPWKLRCLLLNIFIFKNLVDSLYTWLETETIQSEKQVSSIFRAPATQLPFLQATNVLLVSFLVHYPRGGCVCTQAFIFTPEG